MAKSQSGTLAAMEAFERPGTVLARKYRVERVLGRGGMGVVVEAYRPLLDDRVAIKFLLAEHAANSDLVARFLREGRAAAKIKSEHVVRVFDVDTLEDGTPFLVTELLEGEALDAHLKRHGSLSVIEAVDLTLQACEALAEAHASGVVHRDLKPSNLFLVTGADGAPIVKVLDFGISKVKDLAMAAPITAASAIMGTPAYMSPEQLANASEVDGRADIWSLGVILYEVVTGKRPFEADGLPALLMKIVSQAPPDLSANTRVPHVLGKVVGRCLRRTPDERYPDVDALAAELAVLGSAGAARSVARIQRTFEAAAKRARTATETVASRHGLAVKPVREAPAEQREVHVDERVAARTPPPEITRDSRPSGGAAGCSHIHGRSSQTLVATLKGHHLSIKLTAKQLGAALSAGDAQSAARLVKKLRETIVSHVKLEDTRLYPELRRLAERTGDPEMVALVAEFSESMGEIGTLLAEFFERAQSAADLDEASDEWPEIYEALVARMAAEESSLYPLHRDLAMSGS